MVDKTKNEKFGSLPEVKRNSKTSQYTHERILQLCTN